MLSGAKHLGYELKKEILHYVQNDNKFILSESLNHKFINILSELTGQSRAEFPAEFTGGISLLIIIRGRYQKLPITVFCYYRIFSSVYSYRTLEKIRDFPDSTGL
jgi:hypothetical protein